MFNSMKYLFIGSSAACISAAHTIKRKEPDAQLTLLTQQRENPNNTCAIKHVLSGAWPKENTFLPLPPDAELYLQHKIVHVDPVAKQVTTKLGDKFGYDRLIVGIGTEPKVPELFKPYLQEGVFTYHNLDDVVDIVTYLGDSQVKHIAIIGGGLSGVEAAIACAQRGLAVTLIEKEARVVAHETDDMQKKLQDLMQGAITVHCSTQVRQISRAEDKKFYLETDNSKFVADMVLLAPGSKPDTGFLREVCVIDQSGYVMSVHAAYAESVRVIGDCVAQPRIRNGWARAILAGKNIANDF